MKYVVVQYTGPVHAPDAVFSTCVDRETGEQEPLEPLEPPDEPRPRVRSAKGTPDSEPAERALPDDADASRGTSMSLREDVWEFTVNMLSWFIAFGALVFVVGYVAFDAFKARRKGRS